MPSRHDIVLRHRTLCLFALLATLLLAPSPRVTSAQTQSAHQANDGRRFRADSFWVRSWLRGAKDEPELFVEPRQLAVAGNVLGVLDLGTREVIGVGTDSGRTHFTLTARGEGPGEFKRPALLLSNGAQFGVIDHATSRLTMFSAIGALAWDAPVPDAASVESVCVLSGARLLVKVAGVSNTLRVVDTLGRVLTQRSIRAFDPNHPPSAYSASAHLTGPMASDRCALVPLFGAVWYTIDAGGELAAHPYIEPGTEALVQVATKSLDKNWRSDVRNETQTSAVSPIARGALHIGDTLIVQAGATRHSPQRLLDYYLMPGGRYLYSRRLPIAFAALGVGANGTFYGAVIGDEVSSVMALRPTKNAPFKR